MLLFEINITQYHVEDLKFFHKEWRGKIKIYKRCKAFPFSLKSILISKPNEPGSMTENGYFLSCNKRILIISR